MLNQFFALGGVTNLKDFYAKFPTEAHFDRHIKKLRKGGTIPKLKKYQGDVGGSTVPKPRPMPKREDYMDLEEQYQADMDAYLQETAEYQKAIEEENKKAAAQNAGAAAGTTAAGATNAAASGTAAEPKTKLNPYSGGSLVDFLKTQDKASSRQSRKALADKLGITNYTGTPSQNNQILKALRENPGLLDDYQDEASDFDENTYVAPRRGGSRGGSGSGTRYATPMTPDEIEEQRRKNPYVTLPPNQQPGDIWGIPAGGIPFRGGAPGQQQPVDDQGNPIPWDKIAMGAGAAAAGYGAYQYFKPRYYPYTPPVDPIYDPRRLLTGNDFRGGTGGGNPKLPPSGGRAITVGNSRSLPAGSTGNVKGLIGGPGGDDIVKSITARGSYTVDELKQLMKVDPAKAQQMASKFPKFQPSNIVKAVVSETPKVLPKPSAASAANVSWYDDAVRGAGNAYRAIRSSKALKNAGNMLRWFGKIRAEGGQMDDLDMMHYYGINPNYEYGGNYGYGGYHAYDNGGAYPRYNEGGEDGEGGPGWGDVAWGAVQFLDPTGITSWGDAGSAIKRAWNDPSWGNVGSALLETAGALPVVGKLGKAAKGAKYIVEGAQAANTAKKAGVVKRAVQGVGKAADWVDNSKVGKVLQPVKALDNAKWNKVAKGTMMATGKLAAKSPKAGAVLSLARPIQRGSRFFNGFDPLIDMGVYHLDKAAGIAPGQVYDQNQQYRKNGGTYSAGVYYDEGGSFVPSYADSAYGLPKFGMGAMGVPTAMYGMGMKNGGPIFSQHTGYPHQDYVPALDWMQDGGMMQQQGAPQQQGPQVDPQQLMQMVAEMLQQGTQPDQIMQQLVQMGVPQEMAQQVIEQVMQQMQGGQGQAPEQGAAPGQQFQVGGEYNLSHNDIQKLIAQGYQIEYL